MQRGVYFLANDNVLDLSIAFLNSFRKYNPDLPLCFIPYNDNCQVILSMKEAYNFNEFDKPEVLQTCDEISMSFHPSVTGTYRKLAMWEGTFDEFIYIDVDSVVLNNIEFAFNYLDKYDCYTSHSDMPGIRQFVWNESIYNANALSPVQIQYSANTGFVVSRKGVLPMHWIQRKLSDAITLKEHMQLNCQEQPFLNYLIVTSGKRYTSLFTIYQQTQDKRIMFEYWAGTKGASFKKGKFRNGQPYFLVHWAGCWQPRDFDFEYHKILRFLRLTSNTVNPKLHFFMPYKRLWRFYRFMKQRPNSIPAQGASY